MNSRSDDDDEDYEQQYGDDDNGGYDETVLMNAMQSAAEMFAAEGLGNMVDIDTLKRLQLAAADKNNMSSTMEPEQPFEEEDYYEYTQGVESDSSSLLEESDKEIPLTERLGKLSIPPPQTSARSQRAARNVAIYNDYDVETDNDAQVEIENDNDEDSDYENSDVYSSSDNDEHHMNAIHEALRESSGFNRPRHSVGRRARGGRRGDGKSGKRLGRPRGSGRRKRRQHSTYGPEVSQLLGTANRLYVENDLTQAFDTFCSAIRIDPTCGPAWSTMALIREEQGKYSDAQQLCTVAAHMNPSDSTLWERLYSMNMEMATQNEAAMEAGDATARAAYEEATDKAIYSIIRIIRNDPQDIDARMRKIGILKKRNDQKGVIRAYRSMIRADPYNMESINTASRLFVREFNDIEYPIRWYTRAFEYYNDKAIRFTERAIAQKTKRLLKRPADLESDSENDEMSSASDEEQGEECSSAWVEFFYSHPNRTVPMEEMSGGYCYNDVNMLAELRLRQHEYKQAIVDIKRGARFIQGRGREREWEAQQLDDQEDNEYVDESNTLPIELRVRLGQCRLMLGHEKSGKQHINQLMGFDPVEYEDLYIDAAETYTETERPKLAISIYLVLMDYEETNKPSVWERLARNYRDAGDLANARKYGEMVVGADANDLDMLLWLAELYDDLGEPQLAYEMVSAAEDIQLTETTLDHSTSVATRGLYRHRFYAAATTNSRRSAAVGSEMQEMMPATDAAAMEPGVLQMKVRLPSEHTLQKKWRADNERKKYLAAMRSADVAFRKLDLLQLQVDQNRDPGAVTQYCATAQRLYDDWRHMSAFYMTDKARPFRNYRQGVPAQLESSAQNGDLDMLSPITDGEAAVKRRLARMKKRLSSRQHTAGTDQQLDDSEAPSTTFRAQPFTRWLDMFLTYGKCLALDGAHHEAFEMLDVVSQSNVFGTAVAPRRTLWLLMTGVALAGAMDSKLYDLIRWWCGTRPAKLAIYKLFAYLVASSTAVASILTTSNMYKFLRRHLEQLDHAYQHPPPSASLRVSENPYPLTETHPVLYRDATANRGRQLVGSFVGPEKEPYTVTAGDAAALHTIAGHMLLLARAGKTSVSQYTVALTLQPDCAPSALHLGVAYLLLAATPHDTPAACQADAIRGLVYIQRYAELKCLQELDEAGHSTITDHHQKNASGDVVVVQEIAYNYARAFHFLGLTDLAAKYYRRVFDLPVSLAPSPGTSGSLRTTCDLRREAAYNLATMYAVSGSLLKAKAVLKEHCTID